MKKENDEIIFEYGDNEIFKSSLKKNIIEPFILKIIGTLEELGYGKKSDYIPFDEFVEKFDKIEEWKDPAFNFEYIFGLFRH